MSNPNALPADLEAYACDVRDLLGLGEWEIVLKMVDKVSGGENVPAYGEPRGCANIQEPYRIADIEILRGSDKDELRMIVMHEMLHIALSPMRSAAENLAAFLSLRHEQAAAMLINDAEERVVTPLAKALVRGLKPPQEAAQ